MIDRRKLSNPLWLQFFFSLVCCGVSGRTGGELCSAPAFRFVNFVFGVCGIMPIRELIFNGSFRCSLGRGRDSELDGGFGAVVAGEASMPWCRTPLARPT
ncbi:MULTISPECIES: hypothetical protein [Bradyrhizobium]|uniref:hypothetical protein n=1 Tax=Bradyrhizobium TaxID=374 RepID=UPI001E5DC360|nr:MULTISPECIES: hypothetical protein [Bradyrhizobium]MCC8935592.1 hypothetical protein [Bradyrhizobium ivorense]MCC8972381.1 hypothetical protein [Bradyrhizobium brasilense]